MLPKQTIRERGILSSAGIQAECVVEATQISDPAGGPPTYTDIKIAEVLLARFPNGDYDLSVFGRKHLVRHSNGRWITVLSY
jgi:hypothetical protein